MSERSIGATYATIPGAKAVQVVLLDATTGLPLTSLGGVETFDDLAPQFAA